ncbi:MAG TPA: sigma 54-interacting transcriptional regulator [Spirochaetota bacterium]|nr:sigma 54-interacting transcriptional regulator [Spirochaetota bacterium]HOM37789.1 sigma 54-interacting transcriptional regulator [Spirochaetota bacterium]
MLFVFDKNYNLIFTQSKEYNFIEVLREFALSDKNSETIKYDDKIYFLTKISDLNNNIAIKVEDISENKIPSEKLFKYFLNAFEQAYDGIVITDENNNVIYINSNYARFLEVNKDESIGKYIKDVIKESRIPIVSETKKPEIGYVWETKGKPLLVSRIPLFDNGRFIGVIGLILFRNSIEVAQFLKKIEKIEKELAYYKESQNSDWSAKYDFGFIKTRSKEVIGIIERAKKIAVTNSNVIITGESGTGKEIIAHAIHLASPRSNKPFVRINCSAIPEELFESEFFGYEKGAFTGAKDLKQGKFEIANSGTLFLDEIGDLPLKMQAKLLRVIQEGEIERVGGTKPISVDVRIIAATNKNLKELIERGLFREDLYYRLSVFQINMIPLRERVEDIRLLFDYFLKEYMDNIGFCDIAVDEEVYNILEKYSWPGNVRELKNVVETVSVSLEGYKIGLKDIPGYILNFELSKNVKDLDKNYYNRYNNIKEYKTSIFELEKKLIIDALNKANGNKKKAAKLLGIARSLLYKKIKDFGIEL